jgi:uncharacterized membrane protein (Fun14 family)
MEKDELALFKSIKRASILAGIGMGLLLGIIMGLSVSEVVKVIMAALTALLGAFFGFDKQSYTGVAADDYEKQKENTLFTALRAGWFGFAVVVGIFAGMFIRTHEVFTPSVEKAVKQWTDAGYDPAYARKLVTYQRLAINPGTGEAGPVTSITRTVSSNLFSAEQVATLCNNMDPDQWNNNWPTAKAAMLALNIPSLQKVAEAIEANVANDDKKFKILKQLSSIFCSMKTGNNGLCKLGTDSDSWKKLSITQPLADELGSLQPAQQKAMLQALSVLFCELEQEK